MKLDNYFDDIPTILGTNTADWRAYCGEDTTESVIAAAEAGGADVLYPQSNELFIDIDTDEQYNLCLSRISELRSMLRCTVGIKRDVPSNSGGEHRHVIVELSIQIDDATRAGMQMFLGSDPIRELLALRRIMQGVANPIIFIEGGDWKYE